MKNMKIAIFALSFFLMASLCISCSDPISSSTKTCIEPENPYDEDTGHYAGFNWAQENGGTCDGNSESFNGGCNEYYTQLNSYESCLK